jgi:hypothetical protein
MLILAATTPKVVAGNPIKDVGIRDVGPDYGQDFGLSLAEQNTAKPPLGPAKIGAVRTWLALDDVRSRYYAKDFMLRAINDHIEVWVANDLSFPNPSLINQTADPPAAFTYNDCRNGDARTVITDDQAQYLADQFESNIYPKESEAFSVAPQRNGKKALLTKVAPGLAPPAAFMGEGENSVVLVDNVRDTNWYDKDNQHTYSYIAGFFSSQLNDYFDRNVVTVDGFDWLHRTRALPPDNPTTNPCTSAPARPFLYEGVLAHEYQHLLESYEDPDEFTWVDEGLADYAQTLTGYVDATLPITDSGFDSHIQCFLGWLQDQTAANPIPRPASGPENSLNVWIDQGDDEILCDYGAAYSFTLLLAHRYGLPFISALHREDGNGFVGLQNVLDQFSVAQDAADIVHDWAAMMVLDGILDDGALLTGGNPADFQVSTLDATIKWNNVEAYDTPGAPPNGSDYVRLRDGSGAFLGAGAINDISFNGASGVTAPVEWTVDEGALYSGQGDLLDRMIAREVTVPAVGPHTLTFDAKWDTEEAWDFGYVQISTDGGATYESLSTADTTDVHDPAAHPLVVANLPGFTGSSGDAFVAQTADLSPYAGQTIIVAFRYITDWAAIFPGFWVDNVAIDGVTISDGTDIGAWMSQTEILPIPVGSYTVQLVAYDDAHTAAWIGELALDGNFDGTLSGAALDAVIGTSAETVAAIVMYDEPTELIGLYARYTLTVNGVTQPGG